jgi:iron complex transport system ATP-binding protein
MGKLEAAIEVKDLSFAYEGRPILDQVSLEIPEGQFTVLLGKNGSGKSTLMRILAGLLDFERGEVQIMGEEIRSFSSRGRARVLGYLPQHHRPVFPFSVEEVVLTGRASYVTWVPKPEDVALGIEALERVGIIHLRERPYTELSGGEQQLVRIARVLAQQPRLILLDEPSSHLDFLNQAHLLQLIRELVDADLTVLAVLHDPNSAFLYGDHFVFLKDGSVERLPAAERPWDRDFLERIYDTEMDSIPYGDRAFVVPKG